MLHTKKHNKSTVVYLLLETLKLVVSSMLSSTLFTRTLVMFKCLAIVTFLSMNTTVSPTFTNRERILIRIDTATNSLTESHVDCAAFNLMLVSPNIPFSLIAFPPLIADNVTPEDLQFLDSQC